MFGILKCFGGPGGWGVVHTVNSHSLAKQICNQLSVSCGGMYEVVDMNKLALPSDIEYLNEKLGINLE